MAAAGLAGLSGAPSAFAASAGPNLVLNGNAEAAVGAEWTSPSATLPSRHAYGVGSYGNADIIGGGTFAGDTYMFAGGTASTMVAEQEIVLSGADAALVAGGEVVSSLSAFIGGFASQQDNLGLTAEWKNDLDEVLATQTLDAVTNVERRNRTGFLPRADQMAIPAGATKVVVRLTGTKHSGTANDGYIDNIVLRLVTGQFPQLSKAFAPAHVPVDGTSRLTLTVTSRDAVNDDEGWTFTDDLPVGLVIATPADAVTTCPGAGVGGLATVHASDGAQTIGVTGDVEAGESCTVSVDVTSDTIGSYENGADNIGAIGVERPAAPATVGFHGLPAVTLTGPAVGTRLGVGASVEADFACSGTAAPLTCTATVVPPSGPNVTLADGDDLPSGAPGIYTITATVVDAASQSVSTTSRTYQVFAAPTATIAGPDADVALDEDVPAAFTCAAATGLTVTSCTAKVELPDGSTVTINAGDPLPTGDAGNYRITVTIVDELGQTSTQSRDYEVHLPPTVTMAGPDANVGLGKNVPATFSCGASAGLTVASCTAKVELPDGSTVTLNAGDPLPTGTPGGYRITVTGIDELGQTSTETRGYQVHLPPTVAITGPTPGTTGTEGSSIVGRFTCGGSGGVATCEATVRLPDGTSVTVRDGDPLPTGLVGDYELTVTVTDALGQRTTLSRTYVVTAKDPDPVVVPKPPVVAGGLKITQRFTRTSLRPGQQTSLRVRVTNRSTKTLHNVRVCERVPAGLRFVSSTPKARRVGGQYCWTVKTLRPGKYVVRSMRLRAVNRPGRVSVRTRGTANGVPASTQGSVVRVLAPRTVRRGGVTG